jgi:hypothetical protein
MDHRQTIADQLREAERTLALGEKHIARQYGIISELERDGLKSDAERARKLLASFEEVQKEHIARRDLLEQTYWGACV